MDTVRVLRADLHRRLRLPNGIAAIRWWQNFRSTLGRLLRRFWSVRALRWSVLLFPTWLTAAYYFLVAADQFETEARFVVRSAARPEVPSGLAFLVQLGLGRSQDDSFIVQEFMTSRDAIQRLKNKLPLEAMFHRDGADFIARYPSVLFGPQGEEFYRYFKYMASVIHTDKTGISTLRVRAFRPDDARDIAEALLLESEGLVNRINARLQADAIENSLAELNAAQARLIAAQTALTEFRNRELIVDPVRNAISLADLIARLSAELGATQAQITELRSGTLASPQLLTLQRKAEALEGQIARERSQVADDKSGLAARIANYERLSLEKEFAQRMMSASESDLVRARSEAARQLLYLNRIVEPFFADYPTQPKRFANVVTVFFANILLLLIAWLFTTGVRDHAA